MNEKVKRIMEQRNLRITEKVSSHGDKIGLLYSREGIMYRWLEFLKETNKDGIEITTPSTRTKTLVKLLGLPLIDGEPDVLVVFGKITDDWAIFEGYSDVFPNRIAQQEILEEIQLVNRMLRSGRPIIVISEDKYDNPHINLSVVIPSHRFEVDLDSDCCTLRYRYRGDQITMSGILTKESDEFQYHNPNISPQLSRVFHFKDGEKGYYLIHIRGFSKDMKHTPYMKENEMSNLIPQERVIPIIYNHITENE